jgi:Arc/MetJ family transcription regulator
VRGDKHGDHYTSNVYFDVMTRANIDLPDELVLQAMEIFELPTKRSAVEFALRRLLESRMSLSDLDAMVGVGWDADLDVLRACHPFDE